MRRSIVRVIIGTLAATALACGTERAPSTGDVSFSSTALQSMDGAAGQLHIEVRSSPQPPSRGVNAFRLTLTDKNGQPVDGLQVAVQPWMPDMGHGSSVTPTVTPHGDGSYDITNADFFMPGRWQLRTTITGAVNDSAQPTFQIQ